MKAHATEFIKSNETNHVTISEAVLAKVLIRVVLLVTVTLLVVEVTQA